MKIYGNLLETSPPQQQKSWIKKPSQRNGNSNNYQVFKKFSRTLDVLLIVITRLLDRALLSIFLSFSVRAERLGEDQRYERSEQVQIVVPDCNRTMVTR